MNWFKNSGSNKTTNRNIPVHDPEKAKPLSICDYISDQTVCFFSSEFSKDKIFERLISLLDIPDYPLALAAIWEREKAGNTVLESRIAIPHARLQGLRKIEVAVGVRNQSSVPGNEPDLFFLFLISR